MIIVLCFLDNFPPFFSFLQQKLVNIAISLHFRMVKTRFSRDDGGTSTNIMAFLLNMIRRNAFLFFRVYITFEALRKGSGNRWLVGLCSAAEGRHARRLENNRRELVPTDHFTLTLRPPPCIFSRLTNPRTVRFTALSEGHAHRLLPGVQDPRVSRIGG